MAQFTYERWRHGGWYVHEARYFSGAVGCVSRNFADRKWRIVCHPLPHDQQPTFPNRAAAAAAEVALAAQERAEIVAYLQTLVDHPTDGKVARAALAQPTLNDHMEWRVQLRDILARRIVTVAK